MAKIIKAILKWILMVLGLFFTVFMTYIVVGMKFGFIQGDRCKCGGFRAKSHGKLYEWIFK